ncbi:hypothetical protein L1077_21560 [Pseudoalteromonas luteoviolacea]|uniref:hypothetical protein n=1 Tax=Pseudoalteromonas luteoviolacea TaxID=43657 RepID=UPI001F22D19C|nr:hypothetical protein [Pseudoalteromonas luteoviolacea]MCF6442021.1 hypothetical protein [Pseudoalteromonas luteoviolacea]
MSTKSVQDLIVKIKSDGDQFAAGISAATGQAKKFARETEQEFARTESSMIALRGAIAGIGLGIAAAGVGLGSLVASTASSVADMDRMAQSLDVNTTRFDKLSFAASQYGVNQEEFGQLLSDTSERITELVTIGSGEAVDMFEQLNISVDEFKGLKPDEMFIKMFEALSTVNSAQERNLYLQQIGGDAGQALSVIAEDGAANFLELAESMDEYGGALSESAIKESKELDLKLKQLSDTGSITLRNSLVALTPVVSDIADYFADWSKEVTHIFDTMRDEPLTELGLAQKITEDKAALEQLNKELALFSEKKYGYSLGIGNIYEYIPAINMFDQFSDNFDEAKTKHKIFSTYSGTFEEVRKKITADIDVINKRLQDNQNNLARLTGVYTPENKPPELDNTDTEVKSQGGQDAVGTGFVKPVGFSNEQLADIDKNLERVRSALATEFDIEQQAYAQRITWLKQAKDAERISKDEFNALELDAELTHLERIGQIAVDEEAKRAQQLNEIRQREDQERRDRWDQELAELEGFHNRKAALEAAHEDRKRSVSLKGTGQYGQMVQQFVEVDRASGLQRVALAANIGKQLTGEAAKHSKKAFRLNQIVSAGQAMVSTFLAASKALELGPIAGPIAAAGITAMGMMNVMAIKNQPMPQGIAHGGLGYVRDDATYFLQRGESVLSPKQNVEVSKAAEKINTGAASACTTVILNLYEDASKAGQYSQRQVDDQHIIDLCVANINYQGEIAQTMEMHYPDLQRQGR